MTSVKCLMTLQTAPHRLSMVCVTVLSDSKFQHTFFSASMQPPQRISYYRYIAEQCSLGHTMHIA